MFVTFAELTLVQGGLALAVSVGVRTFGKGCMQIKCNERNEGMSDVASDEHDVVPW